MKKSKLFSAMLMCLLVVPQVSFAESLNDKVARLEEKVAGLEESKGSGLNLENVSISGLIEVDASMTDEETGGVSTDTSDIALATVELAFDAKINDKVEGHILFLYEEGEEDDHVIVDEGTITVTSSYGLSLTAGKMYVPFGMFNSHFITDPMTLDLGETGDSAILIGYGTEVFDFSIGIYNGDVHETGDDDEIDDFVASLTVTPMEGLTFGASYISDLADSDAAWEDAGGLALTDPTAGELDDTVAGYSAFISASVGPLTIEAEYLTAADDYLQDSAKVDGLLTGGFEPEAINLELAYAVSETTEVALRWEETDDLTMLEERFGIAGSFGIYDNTTLILEYMSGEYENNDDIDTITAELAIEF